MCSFMTSNNALKIFFANAALNFVHTNNLRFNLFPRKNAK